MAEVSVLDAAGPSTSTVADLEQEVQLAEAKFQQGIQAIKVSYRFDEETWLSCITRL